MIVNEVLTVTIYTERVSNDRFDRMETAFFFMSEIKIIVLGRVVSFNAMIYSNKLLLTKLWLNSLNLCEIGSNHKKDSTEFQLTI